jgi:hypothetical protein
VLAASAKGYLAARAAARRREAVVLLHLLAMNEPDHDRLQGDLVLMCPFDSSAGQTPS